MEEPDVTLLLIRGTACDVVGIDSETVLRNMVSESRIVTSEKGREGPGVGVDRYGFFCWNAITDNV